MSDPVVVIGGGLAGLTCAKVLHSQGVDFLLLEAADALGGRVRTDEADGFLLDRGFQVLSTAYPEASRQLDFSALNLKAFEPGSLIRSDDGFHQVSDPWRCPQHVLKTAFAPVGTLTDKLRIGRLRFSASRGTVDSIFERPDVTTEHELQRLGFTETMIERFLRPFLGGVFLETDLQTTCRMMYFVFRMFSRGDTVLPEKGMGQIPLQLASHLPENSIRLNSPVAAIESRCVMLQSGESIAFSHVVVAAEQPAASRLIPELSTDRDPRSVRCVYFSAPEPPRKERLLILNGTRRGVVNNICVPSQIAPAYAPRGQSLISATVLNRDHDSTTLHLQVAQQMREWFGDAVDSWTHLRTYDLPCAVPNQASPVAAAPGHMKLRDRRYVCGDYRVNGSINGAMESGRRAAEELLAEM